MKNNLDGISIIIPAFGSVETVSNSVFSCFKQCLGKSDEPRPKVEILVMNDDIENPNKYDCFLDMEQFHDKDISIRIIHNKDYMKDENKLYQGGSRLIGATLAKYTFVQFLDCDDILTPNCVRNYWDIIKENEENKENYKPIACIGAMFRSFDSHHQQNDIGKDVFSIWVQGRCWNSDFMELHNLTDETVYKTPINRKQGEDYLFVNMFDYCCEHEENKWQRIMTKDFICGFWIPNYDSLSRKDIYYGQHLAGSTMNSSNAIYDFMKEYNKKNNLPKDTDEFMKHRLLNMNIYAFFNLYDFIWTVGASKNSDNPYIPLEEDWYLLRDNVKKLRLELLNSFYYEIQDNDIVSEYEAVLHRSDARIHNTWEGNFFDYMKKGCKWFNLDYETMMKECRKLEFDQFNCLSSKQVKAWKERNLTDNKKE